MPLSDAPANLKERAKQGDEKAIAAVLNHFFQPQGITAKAALKQGNLLLRLESEMVPDQDTLVPFIHQGLANLGIANINPQVRIGGCKTGDRGTAWQQQIDLEDPPEPIVPDGDNDLPLGDDDMPMEEDDFLDESIADEDEDVFEEDSSLEDSSLEDSSLEDSKEQKSGDKNKLVILIGLLLLLLLGAGAVVYFFFPGLLGVTETTPSQPMSTTPSDSSTEDSEPATTSEANTPDQSEPANTSEANTPDQSEPANTSEANTPEQPEAEEANPETTTTPETSETNEATATDSEATAVEETSTEGNSTNDSSSLPFYYGIGNANKAWEMTQVASSNQDWTEIAILWNDALVMMKQVPESHPQYDLAQDRIPKYRKYREFAKQMAEMTSP